MLSLLSDGSFWPVLSRWQVPMASGESGDPGRPVVCRIGRAQ
jgi:hypothetical protein